MKKLKAQVYVLLLSSSLLIGSCTSPNEKGAETGPDGNANVPELAADNALAGGEQDLSAEADLKERAHFHVVEIKQMQFIPAELTVEKGDTVVWVNRGITLHDVTEQPSEEWTSSPIPVGKSWQLVATESADYYCSLHVVMKGKIVVR